MAKKTRARHAAFLKKGSFYWVQLRSTESGYPPLGWQPARFTGVDVSGNETWDFIGYASADGHHHVDVGRKGPKITGTPK